MSAPDIVCGNHRVLCVDDNRDGADTCALMLRMFGFETHACYDGFTALRLARAELPDVCFIDLNMPGMDGDELAVRLRELLPDRPMKLVALTAMSRPEDRRRTAAAGFAAHLVKPADPKMLLSLVMGDTVRSN